MYRKNVANQHLSFCLIDASDGAALTGATVTAYRSLDGGAQAAVTGTVSELGNGQYNLALSQADTNGNFIGILITAVVGSPVSATAIPVHFTLPTTGANPTDGVRFGLTSLPNAAAEASGGLYTRGTGAGQINQPANGQIDANAVKVGGSTVASGSIPNVAAGASGGLPTVDSTNSVKVQTPLKRNTALSNFTFSMFDAVTGSLLSGLGSGVTATRSIDGGSPASCANAVSEVSSGAGRYKINLASTDLNGTEICFTFTASGAKDTSVTVHTLP